jgi:hypothetical protein
VFQVHGIADGFAREVKYRRLRCQSVILFLHCMSMAPRRVAWQSHPAARLHYRTWQRGDVVGARPTTVANGATVCCALADRAVMYGSTTYGASWKRPTQKAPAAI